MHKFDREGYGFQLFNPADDQFMRELKAVSDEWLGHQVERAFRSNYFDPAYLNTAPIGIVTDAHDKIVAFATFMPTGGKNSDDRLDAPPTTRRLASWTKFLSRCLNTANNTVTYFDLGMAPFG